ncbi:MAG: MerR family transcriptional regulator [Desulfobacterales bacterium]|nr:MerR family transcriptional regulator [Desulfobacterales bacterium]
MASTKGRLKNKNNAPMLKMKELAEAAGVAKSTILLYVNKGLLPQPVKTSPNMAYYDPSCVDRISFIKKIQASHRLPLAAIKGLLKEMDKGRDITPLLELQSTVFGGSADKMDAQAFAEEAGLTSKQLDILCSLKLIIPLEDGLFDDQDLDLARQFKTCLDRGMDLSDFGFYPEFAKKIVKAEIELRETYTKDLDFRENASLTLEMTRMARGLRAYVIDRTLQKELIGFKGLKPHHEEE